MVRSYTDEPVDRAALERIARAARRAPSAGYSQGQALVIVTDDETRQRIAEAMGEPEAVAAGHAPWVSVAPAHIVITVDEELYHARYNKADKLAVTGGREVVWPVPYWYVDAGATLMLVLLAAIEEGLAAGLCGHPDQHERLAAILGLPPTAVPIGVITIGHAAAEPAGAPVSSALTQRRRPAADVIHWQRWGASGASPARAGPVGVGIALAGVVDALAGAHRATARRRAGAERSVALLLAGPVGLRLAGVVVLRHRRSSVDGDGITGSGNSKRTVPGLQRPASGEPGTWMKRAPLPRSWSGT